MRYDLDLDSGVPYPPTSILELAAVAEDNGFGAIWRGESNSPDPFVSLSAIAARTRTIQLGTAAYNVFGRSAVTLGIQAATLNDLSGGRLLLGLALSNQTIASWHEGALDRPVRRMREYADIVRRVARGERVQYEGEIHKVSNFKLSWKPTHPEVPVYFATLGEQMTRLAGRCADGIMVNMATAPMIRDIFGRVRAGAAEAGRDPSTLEYMAKVRVCINPEREEAKNRLRHVLAFYNIAEYYRDMIAHMGFADESARIQEAYREGGFKAAQAAVPDEVIDGLPTIAASSPQEARGRLQPYLECGVTRLIIPFIPSTEDVVGETRAFLSSWRA